MWDIYINVNTEGRMEISEEMERMDRKMAVMIIIMMITLISMRR